MALNGKDAQGSSKCGNLASYIFWNNILAILECTFTNIYVYLYYENATLKRLAAFIWVMWCWRWCDDDDDEATWKIVEVMWPRAAWVFFFVVIIYFQVQRAKNNWSNKKWSVLSSQRHHKNIWTVIFHFFLYATGYLKLMMNMWYGFNFYIIEYIKAHVERKSNKSECWLCCCYMECSIL